MTDWHAKSVSIEINKTTIFRRLSIKKLFLGLIILSSISSFAKVLDFNLSSYVSDIDYAASSKSMGRKWVKKQAKNSLEVKAKNKCKELEGEFVELNDIVLSKVASASKHIYRGSATVSCRLEKIGLCATQLEEKYSLSSSKLGVSICKSQGKVKILKCTRAYHERTSVITNIHLESLRKIMLTVDESDVNLCKTAVANGYDTIFRTLLVTTPNKASDLLKATDIVVKELGIEGAKAAFLDERRKANVPEDLLLDLY